MPATRRTSTTAMQANLTFAKATKNTLLFKEDGDTPVLGSIYVPKATLERLGVAEGDGITVEIRKHA